MSPARVAKPLKLAVLVAIATLYAACGNGSTAAPADERVVVPKVEREGVWQAPPGSTQIPLWPASVPLAKPDTGDRPEATGNGSPTIGGRKWHWATYVTRPTMTVFRPEGRNTGAAMLVLPGGGFYAVAMDLEGTEVCDWVVREGMTCAVLKYRTPQVWPRVDGVPQRPKVLLAREDAQRAMSLLRARSADYGIDPARIGVIGFSAGAYVAADISNLEARTYPATDEADREPSRPDFAILLYTARLWQEDSADTDLGLEDWVAISPDAPPTLLIQTMDDDVDDVRHPLAYALALRAAGVPVDLRIYAEGGHAFGLRPTADPVTRQWPAQVRQWLGNIGILGEQ